MKSLLFLLLFAGTAETKWETDFSKAKETAAKKHELILLNFSGSDWCGPCIRMHKEIFNDPTFSSLADSSLVMVNADFPRNKKHQLSKSLQAQNDMLAEKYDPDGKFPFTVIIDAKGKVIKTFDGLPEKGAGAFTSEMRKLCDANK